MINRYYQLADELEGSVFLFGARQTGKSTFLEEQFKDAFYFDLLDSETKRRFKMHPELLYNMLIDKGDGMLPLAYIGYTHNAKNQVIGTHTMERK